VAMNSLGMNIARSVGPALGGMIVAAAGAASAFTLNAMSYLGLIGVLLTWKQEKEKPRLKEGLRTAMAAGVRYVALSPPVRTVLARALLVGLAASAVPSLLPLVASDLLRGEAATFGFLSGGFGIGAVIGALSNRSIRNHLSSETIVRLALISLIFGAVIVSQSRYLALSLFGLVFCGAGWILAIATMNVSVQMSVPRWVVGRAMSLFQMFVFGSMAVGSFAAGRLSEIYSVEDALLIMAAMQSVSLLAGLVLKLPKNEDENLDPSGRWKMPELKVDVTPRSGPVHVTIRYQIAKADLAEFLATMKTRRRIRMRDGARGWTLSQDLQEPDVWIEHYRFGRWRDYILHNERQTVADVPSLAVLRRLHQGDQPPEVHRTLGRPVNGKILDPDTIYDDAIIDPTRGS
ncbi:MAG: MFS transporter, partial [Ponticaulis sp.]|nr:MFS transporter [Ponticaulis sp.]